MPLYDYVCEKCGHEYEDLVASAEEKSKCPECGSRKTVRQLSAFSVGRSSGAGNCALSENCQARDTGQCSTGCCQFQP